MVLAEFIEDKPKSDFSDPIYHELAILNGEINRLDSEQLDDALKAFNLTCTGCFGVRQKRLKSYVRDKKQEIAGVNKRSPGRRPLDYLLFIDFEATCMEVNPAGFLHEIIEFPIVLFDCADRKPLNVFHQYVRPKINPVLSDFCMQLTGITQSQVDQADNFVTVFEKAHEWMEKQGLFEPGVHFAVVTDGPWDIARFLVQQCMIDHICVPYWASRWINIRKTFTNYYKLKYYPKLPDIAAMLEALGMKFEGRPHSGMDDAKNCAKIAETLLEDYCQPEFNEFLDKYGYSWLLEPKQKSEVVSSADHAKPAIKCVKWRTPQKKMQNAINLQMKAEENAVQEQGSANVEQDLTAKLQECSIGNSPEKKPLQSSTSLDN
ncbi:3'-5' exoribonuclease 1-like [Convolutriloba macropyga]|uniref:3'-5' exoribonuclease 1-like n=1 Tax=Convolutriloba macropyga TaxID=536237 RepID=UPI003F51EA2C